MAQLGAEWVLWLLLLLSLVSVALMIERLIFFLYNRVNLQEISARLRVALQRGGPSLALRQLEDTRGPEAEVLRQALSAAGRGVAAVEEIAEGARTRERLRMERGLVVLGTLGNNAPFIGLFGTVLGIINAFRELAHTEMQQGGTKIMAGISEALVATAVGLLVAIPAVVAFNYFQRQVKRVITQSDSLVHELLAYLHGQEVEVEFAPPEVLPLKERRSALRR